MSKDGSIRKMDVLLLMDRVGGCVSVVKFMKVALLALNSTVLKVCCPEGLPPKSRQMSTSSNMTSSVIEVSLSNKQGTQLEVSTSDVNLNTPG